MYSMAGRGISVKLGLHSDSALVVLVLALFILCTHSWGSCSVSSSINFGSYYNSITCPHTTLSSCVYYGGGSCTGGSNYGCSGGTSLQITVQFNGGCNNRGYVAGCGSCYGSSGTFSCSNVTVCSTQAEADSAKCVLDPTAEGCVEEDVPPSCQADYQQCVGLGGVWQKVASNSTQCASTCNLCGSAGQTKVLNSYNKICCQKDKAPPDSAQRCTPPVIGSGWGMESSVFQSDDGLIDCGSLTTADGEIIQENAARYKRFCLDHDEYEEQVDTNDVGGSSSSGGGEGVSSSEEPKSFGTELEALGGLYGVLDTIRDTLARRLTPATEEIRDCLYNFKLCTALEPLQIDWTGMPQDTSMLQIDTAILKHIKPMMDSSVKLDSAQLRVLKSLDSLYKKGLVNDSQMRILVNEINGNVDGVETAVKGVRHGIDSLIDSMTTYMDKVGQGIGAVGDSIGAIRGILEGEYDGMGLYYDSAGALGDSIRHWISSGDGKYDSAFNVTEASWGVGNLDSSWDSSYAYGMCHGDDCPPCTDSDCLGKITPGILRYGDSVAASLGDSLVKNVRAQEDSLPSQWDSAFARLREVSFFGAFDSTFLANVGAKIPNTNTCPEDCFRQDINGTYAYTPYNMTLDWNLCRPISAGALNGLNAFDILKLLARVITIITCLSILMWEISSRRGGGIGL